MPKETKSKVINSYGGGLEANTLAMLDSTGAKDNRDANEDRSFSLSQFQSPFSFSDKFLLLISDYHEIKTLGLQYLEAVRAASLVPEHGIPPTNKMYQAIFQILRFGRTLELVTSSFQLLIQLHQRFPWVYTSDGKHQLEIVEEAWSPFNFGSDDASVRSSWFQQLIQKMNKGVTESEESDFLQMLGNMFLFEYLVHVLKLDFTPRNQVYEETMNWSLLKESSLNLLLASRRVNFKLLIKDCLSTMSALIDADEKSISLVELQKGTLSAMKEFLVMIMELDASKKKADIEGITTRADGVRTPAMDIILDELTYYDEYLLSSFLQVFDDPKWKLEIVLQYLTKYIPKPCIRTRRSNLPPQSEDSKTLNGILKTISNGTKNITKRIGSDIIQILIGHAFLARFTLSDSKEGESITEICNSIISAFTNLKRVDQKIEILPFGKQVLFTAEMVRKAKA